MGFNLVDADALAYIFVDELLITRLRPFVPRSKVPAFKLLLSNALRLNRWGSDRNAEGLRDGECDTGSGIGT